MAQYNRYSSYDFERFEPKTAVQGSAAPAYKPKTEQKPQIRLVEKPKISKAQLKAQSRAAGFKAAKIFVIATVILCFMAAVIYSRVQVDEITRDISSMETKIKNAQSDSVKLDTELNSMMSIDKVEEIAVNELGMVKVQDYQVVYVDLSSQDRVVKADSKTVDDAVINDTAN